ncbi:aspartate dehydrogenase [Dyella caseinilytica]|uniref:L-aspartate dehydrogenase n=1 Tax=Dyella caseinilytica TaxID=1849581 RepID=A0ABX7GS11_9GAMM|nr:aspartate dehydrogenase [Dyella caseinilytica]QRN53166.1 aspartate dehydrogenase [Dyella caseinilytica]GGA11976.1 putative L-aspartate dehydrogenase [Dyella caseinilytica]
MKKIMLIGYGAMAREVVSRLPKGVQVAWVVVPPEFREKLAGELADTDIAVLDSVTQAYTAPDLVLECAGHAALAEHGETVLRKGWPLAVVSVGALSDALLYAKLRCAASKGHSSLKILSGAVAGMDGLAAAREAGLEEVLYVSRKSPQSWHGSPAETLVDLNTVDKATVFFEGSAGEAARLFPANANVAATIALNGVGMDATRVQLVVDPHTHRNTHRIHARGAFGEMSIELAGHPLPSNPKTSMLAALSAVRACRQLLEPVA